MLKLEMIAPAVDTALGVVAGLYRVRCSDDGDLLLSWAPDFPLEHAAWVVDKLVKSGIEPSAALIADLAPDWAELTNRGGARP